MRESPHNLLWIPIASSANHNIFAPCHTPYVGLAKVHKVKNEAVSFFAGRVRFFIALSMAIIVVCVHVHSFFYATHRVLASQNGQNQLCG